MNPRPVLLLCGCLLAAAPALADGMLIGWDELYETTQVAFLEHDGSRETLHILPKYAGDAAEFAWVVPVPSEPTVTAGDGDVFHQLIWLTQPEYRSRDGFLDCSETYMVADAGNGRVEILEETQVGPYATLVLSADDGAALADMLVDWGYLRPEQETEVRDVLDDYAQRGWYFVAMRVAEPGDEPYYGWYDTVEPVTLDFAATEPVYPLLISRVSAAPQSRVVLYTAADRKLTFPGARTTYANRLTAPELDAVRDRHPALGARLAPGDFLTRLERTYAPSEMTGDLALTAAADQSEFREIVYSGWPVGLGLIGLLLTGLGTRRLRRR